MNTVTPTTPPSFFSAQTSAAAPLAPPPANASPVVILLGPGDEDNARCLAQRGVLLCKPGQPIARAITPSEGTPLAGVPAERFRAGKNVAWDAVQNAWIARVTGHARFHGSVLHVEDTLEFTDDLDPSQGPVAFAGDLVLQRNVLDLVELRGGRDIVVHGCVEAANVHAARDITIHHGICGKEKGSVQAGKCLSARFLTNARVHAGGDVIIENVSDNSLVQCAGELRVDRGTILSGRVVAGIAIHCRTAGAQAGARAILELGLGAEQRAAIQRLAAQAVGHRHRATEIRALIQPLMANSKALTAAQKERATELLCTADECEAQARQATADLERANAPLVQAAQGRIHVASELFAGVIIRFPGAQAAVPTFLRGPLTLHLHTISGRPAIVSTDDYRGTQTILPPLAPLA